MKKFGVVLWRIGYFGYIAYFVFFMLIPGIYIINSFDSNIENIKKAEGAVFFKRIGNKVQRIGIELPDGRRILFFCDAGLFSNSYYCLRQYRDYSAAKKIIGHKVKVEWFDQDIPFRPQASRMLLSLAIDGVPNFSKNGILDLYKKQVGMIKYILLFAFLFIAIFILGFEAYHWRYKHGRIRGNI